MMFCQKDINQNILVSVWLAHPRICRKLLKMFLHGQTLNQDVPVRGAWVPQCHSTTVPPWHIEHDVISSLAESGWFRKGHAASEALIRREDESFSFVIEQSWVNQLIFSIVFSAVNKLRKKQKEKKKKKKKKVLRACLCTNVNQDVIFRYRKHRRNWVMDVLMMRTMMTCRSSADCIC